MNTAAVIVCSIIFSIVAFLIFVISAYGYDREEAEEMEVEFYDEPEWND